ncbi:MAG: glycosyltransferase family 2 protein [Mediterranea sp.]|nr:glycosyltransferase family 2 protein [Mediterranea sp.]
MEDKKTLTVFTPAYNRAHTIGRTYESLCRQTSKDFCWLVIDDGSSDHTGELVKGWMAEGKIPIRYIYQQNQGMHGAHNTAYRNIETELNTCIDSDDYMPDDAVEKIVTYWQKYGNEKYAGLVGLDRAEGTEGIIGTSFPDGVLETTLQGFYERGGKGDKKLVYRTEVIRRYPEYPLFEGERYVGLAYKYMLIDQDYTLLTLNEPLVIVEYQDDGSSVNMYKQYWNNPKGFAFYRKTEMQVAHGLKRRFVVCAHYVASSFISGNRRFLRESPDKLLTLLAVPAGWALYLLIKRNVRRNKKLQKTS